MTNEEKPSWWRRLKTGFAGLQHIFMSPLRSLFGSSQPLSEETRKNLKRHFIEADFGPELTHHLLEIAQKAGEKKPENILPEIKSYLRSLLPEKTQEWSDDLKCLILAGVNGAGKTTTIAKIAHRYQHRSPLLIPADTYRAAALEQLREWSLAYKIPFFEHQLSDPSAVAFQGLDYALKNNHFALIDTSGRLPNNQNLMSELNKTQRVVFKKITQQEQVRTVLVLDASQGQNLIEQVRLFNESIKIDALIITKLDGSSKAGTLFQISRKYKIPIDYCGVGEKIDDLVSFEPQHFIDSLWGQE